MATKEKFQIQPEKRNAFDKRVAKATGKITVEQARRESARNEERQNVLAKMWDKVDLLDMSEQGSGLSQLTSLLLESAESEKPPMIFTKPSKVARDPTDVAFGDKNFSGKNIIAVADGAVVGQQELKQLQTVFAEGLTLVGRDSNLGISYADYEHALGPNDAVVVLHEAQLQEQIQPQDSVKL